MIGSISTSSIRGNIISKLIMEVMHVVPIVLSVLSKPFTKSIKK
jgi:hypothetical protein